MSAEQIGAVAVAASAAAGVAGQAFHLLTRTDAEETRARLTAAR